MREEVSYKKQWDLLDWEILKRFFMIDYRRSTQRGKHFLVDVMTDSTVAKKWVCAESQKHELQYVIWRQVEHLKRLFDLGSLLPLAVCVI